MSYQAKVFNVMVAAPSDVGEELSIIKEVIDQWNTLHSESKKIVLLPTHWKTHSSPEMGRGPQDIINAQVLAKCDLLVGVFWTRIGTETPNYQSGTVEEINKHSDSGKITMLYFSNHKIEPSKIDLNQKKAVEDFKKQCKNLGLYADYNSHEEFKEKFNSNLTHKINNHSLFQDIHVDKSGDLGQNTVKDLSEDACNLLKEASMGVGGIIYYIASMGGRRRLETNGRNFIESIDRREIAKWDAVLEELKYAGLIVAKNGKGTTLNVTHEGYKTVDKIDSPT